LLKKEKLKDDENKEILEQNIKKEDSEKQVILLPKEEIINSNTFDFEA